LPATSAKGGKTKKKLHGVISKKNIYRGITQNSPTLQGGKSLLTQKNIPINTCLLKHVQPQLLPHPSKTEYKFSPQIHYQLSLIVNYTLLAFSTNSFIYVNPTKAYYQSVKIQLQLHS
jgi:hypothetical protein